MRIVFRAAGTFAAFLFLAKAASAGPILAAPGDVLLVNCPSFGDGTPVGAFPPNSGCAEVDKSFTDFIDTVLLGSLGTGAEFGFSASGADPVGNTLLPVTAELNVLGTQALTPSYQEEVTYTLMSNTGGEYLDGTFPSPATPGATWAISGLTFLPSISVNGNGQSATASEQFCLNAGSVTGCPTADAGEIDVSFLNGGSSTTCSGVYCVSGDGNAAHFPSPVTQVAIDFNVNVNGATARGVTLNNFDTEFSGVAVLSSASDPEPSTLLMAGVGLACLVWHVRRRRLAV